jgi:hypothetical protein
MTDDAEREALCRRCGRCCYARVVIGDEVYSTDVPCPYLDVATRLCTVYERRFEVNEECVGVAEGIKARTFPADCPYVAGLRDYRPPREDADLSEMGRLYRQEP